VSFKRTPKQDEATRLMASNAKHIMLFGGSRSGKTFQIIRSIIIRACKTKSRHVSLRSTFNSIKTSIWMDTLPKVLALCFPDLKVHYNRTDYVLMFPNGSEYWMAGLDTAQRVEKILGKEYSTLHFNECSNIDYTAVQIALSRLAEKSELKKKVYYDQNPPPKSHWSYWLFEKKLNPIDDEPLRDPDNYAAVKMNPQDNIENIDENYIAVLESMPADQRKRFLDGEYQDVDDGQTYYAFNRERHVQEIKVYPGTHFIGMDFNVEPMTAVIFQFINDQIQVFDEVFMPVGDTPRMIDELKKRNYSGLEVIPDSTSKNRKTSGKSDFDLLKEAGFKVHWSFNPLVYDRVVNINLLFTQDKIIIDPKCKKLINDLEKVSWKDNQLDQKGANKMLTHISDALGYGCYKLMPLNKVMKDNKIKIGTYR